MLRMFLCLLFVCGLGGQSAIAQDGLPTYSELLQRHLRARGGIDALREVQSYRVEGTLTAGKDTYPLRFFQKRPNLLRIEVGEEGDRNYQVFDGDNAWFWTDTSEAQKLDPVWARYLERQAQFITPLMARDALVRSRELVGESFTDQGRLYQVRLEYRDGAILDVYLNANTYLEQRTEYRMNAEAPAIVTEFHDWDSIGQDGLMMAHRQVMPATENTPRQEIVVEDIDVNPGLLTIHFQAKP